MCLLTRCFSLAGHSKRFLAIRANVLSVGQQSYNNMQFTAVSAVVIQLALYPNFDRRARCQTLSVNRLDQFSMSYVRS